MSDAAARGRRSRRKGKAFEREIASAMRAAGFGEARRGLQSRGGGEVPDVEGTPWWVECKVGKSPRVLAAYEQAREATDGRPVLVVTKWDRGPTLVTMDLSTFLEMEP